MSGHCCVERLTGMEHMAISYITRKSITLSAGSKLVPRHNLNPLSAIGVYIRLTNTSVQRERRIYTPTELT